MRISFSNIRAFVKAIGKLLMYLAGRRHRNIAENTPGKRGSQPQFPKKALVTPLSLENCAVPADGPNRNTKSWCMSERRAARRRFRQRAFGKHDRKKNDAES